MPLTLTELLQLEKVGDEIATHYLRGDTVVASIFKHISNLQIKAQLGDDEHVINFGFEYSGPVAIIYTEIITMENLEGLQPRLGVMAIMSAVTFADISMWIGRDAVFISPTIVRQYDAGIPELYDLARQLICYYTETAWDENFLVLEYRKQTLSTLQLLTSSLAGLQEKAEKEYRFTCQRCGRPAIVTESALGPEWKRKNFISFTSSCGHHNRFNVSEFIHRDSTVIAFR